MHVVMSPSPTRRGPETSARVVASGADYRRVDRPQDPAGVPRRVAGHGLGARRRCTTTTNAESELLLRRPDNKKKLTRVNARPTDIARLSAGSVPADVTWPRTCRLEQAGGRAAGAACCRFASPCRGRAVRRARRRHPRDLRHIFLFFLAHLPCGDRKGVHDCGVYGVLRLDAWG